MIILLKQPPTEVLVDVATQY